MTITSEMPTIDVLLAEVCDFLKRFRRFHHAPTAIVMTRQSVATTRTLMPERTNATFDRPDGLPVEHYATAGECLDRMLRQRRGERLQLVLAQDDVRSECTHKFWTKLFANKGRRFLPPIFFDKADAEFNAGRKP